MYLHFLQFEIKRPVTESIPNPLYVSIMTDQANIIPFSSLTRNGLVKKSGQCVDLSILLFLFYA